MVNDNILIKYERSRGHKHDWPDIVIAMKQRMIEMKLGFPGIGNDHMSLVPFSTIEKDQLFIWDPYVESMTRGDEAPILFKNLGDGKARIEGIGCGIDSVRDPDRTKLRWMDIVDMPQLPDDFLVFRVDVRPTLNGGPGYYYFFKSYRDFRY
jgi:hypothetical protein